MSVVRKPEYKGGMVSDQPVELTVRDGRGHTKRCSVVPQRIWFGHTDRFRESQWLIETFNVDLHMLQTFPLTSVSFADDTDLRVPHGPGDRSAAGGLQLRS
jgi:hypothetical protein